MVTKSLEDSIQHSHFVCPAGRDGGHISTKTCPTAAPVVVYVNASAIGANNGSDWNWMPTRTCW